MALDLADHVFHILENQHALFEFLGEHDWGFSMEDGTLSFAAADDGRPIADCPAQVLGSQSDGDGSWLWGWANVQSQIPEVLLRAVQGVREQAEVEGSELFLESGPIESDDDMLGPTLAIIAAGAANLYTYYACGYDGGCLFVGLESPPPGLREGGGRAARRVVHILQMGISALEFDHRRAVLAYLGEPGEVRGDRMTWTFGPESLEVTFDEQGRIARMATSETPRARS